MKKQIFKPYEQNQAMLLPPSVEELIPEAHIVRIVNGMIGAIDKKILESDFIPRLEKYEKYEKIFKGRNSFCKTDTDATFMRMKEDHMLNG